MMELLQTDYEGIAKVLTAIVELYKVCENKKLVDNVLESFALSSYHMVVGGNDNVKIDLNKLK